MTKEQQKHIFKPYYQITHKKWNIQGVGMGLTIVKNIIDEVDGKITLSSTRYKGTTFELILKRHVLSPDDIIQTNKGFVYSSPLYMDMDKTKNRIEKLVNIQYKETRPAILVVEDNKEMMVFLKKNMKELFNFYYAYNGSEALIQLSRIPRPNVIISDIMMDKMDGYEFYEELRKKKIYASIPFIFLTAVKTQEEKLRALQKGAIDFISKPFSIDELLAKITSIIKVQQELKELYIKEIEAKYHKYINRSAIPKDIPARGDEKKINHDFIISKRESEIIYYLTKGHLYKEIAYELNISINTVREYIKRLYKKCGIQNKIELINIFKK